MEMYEADQRDKKKIEEAKRKIKELSLRPDIEEKEDIYTYPGETDIRTRKININNKEKIAELEKIITQAEQRIADRQRNRKDKRIEDMTTRQNENDRLIKEKIEREKQQQKDQKEKKEMEKLNRELYIKDLKRRYKSGSKFERFLNLINGKKPKWKKIAQFSTEELEFLLDYEAGRTINQQKAEENMIAKGREKSAKDKKRQRWISFSKLLRDREHIKIKMEMEEELAKDSPYGRHHR